MEDQQCSTPGCRRRKLNSCDVCQTHAGLQTLWFNNLGFRPGQSKGGPEKTPQKSKRTVPSTTQNGAAISKAPPPCTSSMNVPQHPPPQQSSTHPVNVPFGRPSGISSQEGLASSTEHVSSPTPLYYLQQFMHSVPGRPPQQQFIHNVAGRLPAPVIPCLPDLPSIVAGSMIHSAAVHVPMLPHFVVPPHHTLGMDRDLGAGGDVSVFRLTPGHKGRGTLHEDSHNSSEPRPWHTPYTKEPSAKVQQTGLEVDSSAEHSCDGGQQHTQPELYHGESSDQQVLAASPMLVRLLQDSRSAQNLSLQCLLSAETQEQAVNHHSPSTQQTANTQSASGIRSSDHDEDVIITGADEDVLFVGTEPSGTGTHSSQQALSLTAAGTETVSESDSDDCIIIDLSVDHGSQMEQTAQGGAVTQISANGHSIVQQGSEDGWRADPGSALSSDQDPEAMGHGPESEKLGEITVLETVSLSEQPSTSFCENGKAKTFSELSEESYYRCSCLSGRCGFRTVLSTQLELHLKENHPHDVMYSCVHCGSREAGIDSLMSHLEQHLSSQELLHCSNMFCQYMSSSSEEVHNHIQTCHPMQVQHVCWVCSDKFHSFVNFSLHIKLNLISVFKCPHCSAKDVDQQAVLMHMASSHPDQERLVDIQKMLVCHERKKNHWYTTDYVEVIPAHMEESTALVPGNNREQTQSPESKRGGDAVIGRSVRNARRSLTDTQIGITSPSPIRKANSPSIRMDKPGQELPLFDAQQGKALSSEGLVEQVKSSSKRSGEQQNDGDTSTTTISPSKRKALRKKQNDGDTSTTTISPSKRKALRKKQNDGDTSTTTISPSKRKALRKEQNDGDTSTTTISPSKRKALRKEQNDGDTGTTTISPSKRKAKSKKMRAVRGQNRHSDDQTNCSSQLSKESEPALCTDNFAGKNSGMVESVDTSVNDSDKSEERNFVERRPTDVESTNHKRTTGEASDGETEAVESEGEKQTASWIDHTFDQKDVDSFKCSFCDHVSSCVENHSEHIHSSHRSQFKGFSCQQCSFVSVDQGAKAEHRCGGSHCLQARSRIGYSEDDKTLWYTAFELSDMSVTGVTEHASETEYPLKTRSKRKHSETSAVSPPSKVKTSARTDFPPAKTSKVSPETSVEGSRSPGTKLMCTLCGLKQNCSRISMHNHIYAQHGDAMVCPICLEKMGSDCHFHLHLMDLHPNHPSIYDEVKSQNFISQVNSSDGVDVGAADRQKIDSVSGAEDEEAEAGSITTDRHRAVIDSGIHEQFSELKDTFGSKQSQLSSGIASSPEFKSVLRACKLCGFSSGSPVRLSNHMYREHSEVMKCPRCDVQLTSDSMLSRHVRAAHREDEDTLYQQCRSLSWVFEVEKLLSCKLCGYSNSQSAALHEHMYTAHKAVMKCPRCDTELTSDQELYQHLSDNHAGEKDSLYSQHCSASRFHVPGGAVKNFHPTLSLVGARQHQSLSSPEASRQKGEWKMGVKGKQWVARKRAGCPMLLTIKKKSPAGNTRSQSRQLSQSDGGSQSEASQGGGSGASDSPATVADVHHLPQPVDSSSAVPMTPSDMSQPAFSRNYGGLSYAAVSSSVPLMSKEQYDAFLAMAVEEDMEYRCPHCTSDFKLRYKFFEHLCFHYHYRCFKCAQCPFLAFCGSSVVNHCKKNHKEYPDIIHIPKQSFEARIERVLCQSLAAVTDPHTERRLLAYERARLKKESKCQGKPGRKPHKIKLLSSQKIKLQTKKIRKVPSLKMKAPVKSPSLKIKAPVKSPKKRPLTKKRPSEQDADADQITQWLICPYCRGKKKKRTAVEHEIRFHIHYKPYCCSYCKFTSSSERYAMRHVAATHPGKGAAVDYKRDEKKEERFQLLFSRSVELSKTAVKQEVTSGVKRKYKRRKADSVTDGKLLALNPGPIKKEENLTAHLQPGSTKEIECAHCDFVSDSREAVLAHILENHQPLLEEAVKASGADADTSLTGASGGFLSDVMDGEPPAESADSGNVGSVLLPAVTPEGPVLTTDSENTSHLSTENQNTVHLSTESQNTVHLSTD
ncbi:uncharacterized protein LOC143284221 [Babylonia areolata]|uniref:uncharacterized protein LOC143284221 n=1 Tax=Babylonia areolata TaxID=304850 RepID=UPI003FCFC7D8